MPIMPKGARVEGSHAKKTSGRAPPRGGPLICPHASTRRAGLPAERQRARAQEGGCPNGSAPIPLSERPLERSTERSRAGSSERSHERPPKCSNPPE